MSAAPLVLAALFWSSSASAAPQLSGGSPPAQRAPRLREAPFRVLDNVEGDDIDLLNYPIEPMVTSPDHGTLWAVNTHGSEVVGFTATSGRPERAYPVPWDPVSLEYWVSSADGHHELLVVTRGTYGLTRLAPANGAVLGYLALPPEPGGTLLLGDRLYVACSAFDQVVEVDLPTNAIVQTFEIDTTRHLLFLSSDGLGNVLVTPLCSGNDSMPRRSAVAGVFASDAAGNVLDMGDPTQADLGLPDEDVFRIVPGATPGAGHVEVAAKGVGTMLFAHGVNPVTGKLWVLNTDSVNADLVLDTEAELRGVFSKNRLTIVTLPAPGGPPATSHTIVSLDDVPPAPLGKPFALSFSASGTTAVVGTLTDNVSILSSSGAHLRSFDLPEGSIPRGVLTDETTHRLYVYCWGTNKIEVRNTAQPALPKLGDLDLGYDPTSETRKEGRRIFYDGHNSLNGNVSCESCHVEGQFDHLVWNLSELPLDDKGALFTQNLKGLEFLRPYGWRGEHELVDFNHSFDSLLGGTPLTPEQFAAFQEFLFGLQNPANPFEDPRRVVSDRKVQRRFPFATHGGLSAVNGQEIYFSDPTVGSDTCQECHQLPTGTNNDFFPAAKGDTGHRNVLKNTPYNGMWRKEQKTRVTVKERFRPSELRPPLGAGASRAGLANGLFEFSQISFNSIVPVEDHQDLAFFVHQIDQGLAPAVHRAVLISRADPRPRALAYFVQQCKQRNCDLVVLGRVQLDGQPRRLAWYWDRALRSFVSEDRHVAPRPLDFFSKQAELGPGANLLIGMPVGMGRRFAVDPDDDLLFTADERELGTNLRSPDSDGDGFLDGTEVRFGSDPRAAASTPSTSESPTITSVREMYCTTRVAKLLVEADRPVKIRADYSSSLGDVGQFVGDEAFKTLWEVALLDLQPSNEIANVHRVYGGTLTVTDEFGHVDQAALPSMETVPSTNAFEQGVPNPIEIESCVRALTLVSVAPSGLGGYELTLTARVENRKLDSAPLANHVAVVRVIRNGAVASDVDVQGTPPASVIHTELSFTGLYGGFGGFGPFVVGSPSAADGVSTLTFRLPSAASGDRVQVALEMVGRPLDAGSFDPSNPSFDGTSLFDIAGTPPESRASAEIVLP